jgi:anti-sigma factor RsiW
VNGKGPFDPRKEAPLLSAYVDGELDAQDNARIEAHLAEDEETRREVEQLRRLKQVTGSLRLKEPPPEVWEDFWQSAWNRGERTLGWLLFGLAVLVLGGWGVTVALRELLGTDDLPLIVKGAVLGGVLGTAVLLVSVLRERLHKRSRTRYKDVVR